MITAPRCRHIKTNGLTCKSPALRDDSRCFFHKRQMLRHARFNSFSNPPSLAKPGDNLPLVPIEDHDSIQLALSLVINGLAIGHLEPLRAKVLLYGLQIASINAKNTRTEPSRSHEIALTTDTDPIGDELAQPGDTVDVADPAIAFQKKEAEARARIERFNAEDDDEEDEEDDDEDEDSEEDEEDDAEDYDDEQGEEDIESDEEDSESTEQADLKLFNLVDSFMRRHP